MPLPTITDCWRVTLNWTTASGITPHNVIHIAGSWSGTTDAELALALIDNMTSVMFGGVSSEFTLNTFDILKLDGTSAGTNFPAGDLEPDGHSGEFSPNVALIVGFHTAVRGPSGRGRMFQGPVAENDQANGLYTGTATRTDIIAGWVAFQTAMIAEASSLAHVVASYKDESFAPVSNYQVPEVLATQRRRQDQLR